MKTMKNMLGVSAILGMAALMTFTSCEKAEDTMDQKDIVDVAVSTPEFSILVDALGKAGLVGALKQDGPFTVFAPTNAAFGQLFDDLGVTGIDDLSAETLAPILLYHVIGAEVKSTDLTTGYVTTLSDGPGMNKISMLVDASAVKLNSTISVTSADIMATNGVIHVIDKVMLPPTVVDIAIQNSNFSTLVAAVVKAELVETLSGTGPFTVFAPTNAAFTALFTSLGVSGIADLTKEQLIPILTYHVVSGNVRSTSLSSGSVATLNGDITVNVGAGVTINTSTNVVATDVQGSNGVVHVIDKVLLPPTK